MRVERFADEWRGNGVQVVLTRWTLALRWRWRLRFVRPPMKAGYTRLYAGPFEVEHRKAPNVRANRPAETPQE